ncbi:MAG TPA: hypothetical protein VG797_02550, partial [Phycisphaerales bacterium]|nr:hypothetical protein [Phycisphaerales bacterium]
MTTAVGAASAEPARGSRGFTLLLIVSSFMLMVLVGILARQNRNLKNQLAALQDAATGDARSIEAGRAEWIGRRPEPVDVADAAGAAGQFSFTSASPMVVMIASAHC